MDERRIHLAVHEKRSQKQIEPFVKGPIPLGWIREASNLGGSALDVGLFLWYRWGLNREQTFAFGLDDMQEHGFEMSRSTVRRALAQLKGRGLVTTTREEGQKHRVRIETGGNQTGVIRPEEWLTGVKPTAQ